MVLVVDVSRSPGNLLYRSNFVIVDDEGFKFFLLAVFLDKDDRITKQILDCSYLAY